MIDVFGDQSRNALANMLAANDNKDGDDVSVLYWLLCRPSVREWSTGNHAQTWLFYEL